MPMLMLMVMEAMVMADTDMGVSTLDQLSGVLEERSVMLMLMPMDMEVMEAVLLSTQLVPLTVDVPSGVSVERDLLMPMPTDMEVMEVVLPSIQLVPHMLPEAHKDSVESDLLNHGDSATTLFLETPSSPEAYQNTTQEELSVESVQLSHSDMASTTMPFPETLSFANPVSVTTQEVFSAVNQFL